MYRVDTSTFESKLPWSKPGVAQHYSDAECYGSDNTRHLLHEIQGDAQFKMGVTHGWSYNTQFIIWDISGTFVEDRRIEIE